MNQVRNIRDVSQQFEDDIDTENDIDEIIEQIKRDVERPHKRSQSGYYKRFYNVEMLKQLSSGLFGMIPDPSSRHV